MTATPMPGARCASDPDAWFTAERESREVAATICLACPWTADCAERAAGEEWGVWGGVSRMNHRTSFTATLSPEGNVVFFPPRREAAA